MKAGLETTKKWDGFFETQCNLVKIFIGKLLIGCKIHVCLVGR